MPSARLSRGEELVRDLHHDAGAVAHQRIGAHGAAMLEVLEDARGRSGRSCGTCWFLQVDDEADAAGIVLVRRVVEALGVGTTVFANGLLGSVRGSVPFCSCAMSQVLLARAGPIPAVIVVPFADAPRFRTVPCTARDLRLVLVVGSGSASKWPPVGLVAPPPRFRPRRAVQPDQRAPYHPGDGEVRRKLDNSVVLSS